uniref:hypothetical protein n=1 Tax=Flavobacterium sp. TaxID=239 RepID=UPI0033415842
VVQNSTQEFYVIWFERKELKSIESGMQFAQAFRFTTWERNSFRALEIAQKLGKIRSFIPNNQVF